MLVLRVLNGPLFGAEVVVPQDGCFVRVVDLGVQAVDALVEQSMEAVANGTVLTIPLIGLSPNFRLLPRVKTDGMTELYAEIYQEEQSGQVEHRPLPLNQPVMIGRLSIAVCGVGDVWSDAVVLYRGVGAEKSCSPGLTLGSKWPHMVIVAVLSVLSLVTLVGMAWPASVPAADITRLLAGQSVQVLDVDGHPTYVFVNDASEAASVRRMLAKASMVHVQIRVRAQEVARIGSLLDAIGIRYFSVDLEDPRRPRLLLRQEAGIKPSVPTDLDARLRSVAPYVSSMSVQWRSEEEAQQAARFLVEEIDARATYRRTPEHFVATIDDYLSDAQLDAISRALTGYQHVWGKRYVHFQINQRDMVSIDGLKTGRLGYELRSAHHIYFPPS